MKTIQQYLFEVSDETLKSAIAKADAKIKDPKTDRLARFKLRQQKEAFEKYLNSAKHKQLVKVEEILRQGTAKPKDRNELLAMIYTLLKNGHTNLNVIDVSDIKDLSRVFAIVNNKVRVKNINISEWDTSNATDMEGMFFGCGEFNADLSKWDVSSVRNMGQMFAQCKSFNSNLSKWDVSNVWTTVHMFYGCESFNSDLSKWNVSRCNDMSHMFYYCSSFNSDLSKWDVSNCTDMTSMFQNCYKFKSDLSKWDVSNCKCFDYMFFECESFNSDLSEWNVLKAKTHRTIYFSYGSKIGQDKSKLPDFNAR